MSSVEVKGLVQATRTMELAIAAVQNVTPKALMEAAQLVTAYMKQQYLTNGPLHVRTGRLRGGWSPVPFETPDELGVVVGTAVKYARVHNYGFSGPVQVKEHMRSKPRSNRARRGPRSQKGRLRQRAESRRAGQFKAQRERDSRKAHGLGLRGLQARSRTARRLRGLQAGIAPATVKALRQSSETGKTVVRAHGRFMKIRGHLYVERSLRDTTEAVGRLLAKRLEFKTGGGANG